LSGQKFLESQVEKMINVYKKEGGENTCLPGESGDMIAKNNLKADSVEISEEVLDKIKKFINLKR